MEILVCDRSTDFARYLNRKGPQDGYSVTYASTSTAAGNELSRKKFDGVIVCGQLKDCSGLEFVDAIGFKERTTVVVALDSVTPQTRDTFMQRGADQVLPASEIHTIITSIKVARKKQELSSTDSEDSGLIQFGRLRFDLVRNVVYDHRRGYQIVPRRSRVLQLWVGNAFKLASLSEMMDAVYGTVSHPTTDRLHTFMIDFQRWLDRRSRFTIRFLFTRTKEYVLLQRDTPLEPFVFPNKHTTLNMIDRKLTINKKVFRIPRHNLELLYLFLSDPGTFFSTRELASFERDHVTKSGLRRMNQRIVSMRKFLESRGFPGELQGVYKKGYRIMLHGT